MSNRPLSFKRQAIRFSTASLPHSSSSKILSTCPSSSEPVRSSSPHSSARNTASDGCKPCALAVKRNIQHILCAIHQGLERFVCASLRLRRRYCPRPPHRVLAA